MAWSTRQHGDPDELQAWFAGKAAYRLEVNDLGPHGFPLLGGRLDYLLDKPVATLVYGRSDHPISLFVLPAKSDDPIAVRGTKHGYNVVGWSDGAFAYFAASDLARSELDKLEERAWATARPKGRPRCQSKGMPMSELFRREAVQHATRRLDGEVVLATPLSVKTLGLFLRSSSLPRRFRRRSRTYARKATVTGLLVPDQGMIRVTLQSAAARCRASW